MEDLSESTYRKFIESIELDDFEILTEDGFKGITHVHKTIPYEVFEIKLSNGYSIKCADTHILINSQNQQIYAKDSLNSVLLTDSGEATVIEVISLNYEDNMYDITVDSDNHTYYTNGILSHNTTTATCLLLHYAIFNDAKRIYVLANKESSRIDILERIQLAYEALPKWLQRGVKEWNKKSVTFENKSKIVAAATSSSSIRGKSCSFLYIDEAGFIEGWDEFYASTYPTITSGKTTKMLFTSTANGLNHFYDFWKGATEGTKNAVGDIEFNNFAHVKATWDMIPGRDSEWKEGVLKSLNYDMEKFGQEYECVSGEAVITLQKDQQIFSTTLINFDKMASNRYQTFIPNSGYAILTPYGFEAFDGLKKSISDKCINFIFDDNTNIITTRNHKFIAYRDRDEYFYASEVKIGNKISGKIVKDIIQISTPTIVYDVLETRSHTYIANDIVHHNCEFIGSSGTLLNAATLKSLTPHIPIVKNDSIKQYFPPEKEHIYVLCADVSRGKGLDYSAYHIIDVTAIPYRQVCVFRSNKIGPTDFATIIHQFAKLYNEAYCLIENNDLGAQTIEVLFMDYGYENVLATESAGRAGKRIAGGFGNNGKAVDMGIRTTEPTKRLGCSVLKLLMEQHKFHVVDKDTIDEFNIFSKSSGTYKAEGDGHDDLVMGLVLFAWLTQDHYFKNLTDTDINTAIREKTDDEWYDDLTPFGVIHSGAQDDSPKLVKFKGESGIWEEYGDDNGWTW